MSKVFVNGVILPESYWLDENVATVVDFRRALADCKDGIDLCIDSPGGDVFASNTMSALIAEWCLEHPSAKCHCVIGGLCASAAANIVAKLPKCFDISCYEDSLIMFHSCYGIVEGSPETLRDNAELMDLVNQIVMDKLMQKTTLDPERIKNAFRAGREMWLDGKEAQACGLVDEVLGGEADTTVRDAVYEDKKEDDAYRYAACVVKSFRSKMEAKKTMTDEEMKAVSAEATAEAANEAAVEAKAEETEDTEDTTEETEVVETKAECGEETEKKAECGDDTEKEPEAEADDAEKEPEAEADGEIDALKAENQALRAEVESLKAIVAKYSVEAAPEPAPAGKTFAEMVKEIPAGLSQSEYARRYVALKKAHKAEFDAFMASRTAR